MPNAQHFEDLVESTLNLKEDGFERSEQDGVVIKTGRSDNLLSYSRYDTQDIQWRVSLNDGSLQWSRPNLTGAGSEQKPAMSLSSSTVVSPAALADGASRQTRHSSLLDIAGFVRSEGRSGSFTTEFNADKTWRPITLPLRGCHAFEVVAGASGKPGDGRYALMHAIALKAHQNSRFLGRWIDRYRGIRMTQNYYRSRHYRLRLRWWPWYESKVDQRPESTWYRLYLKCNCRYDELDPESARVRVQVQKLWDDPSAEIWDQPLPNEDHEVASRAQNDD